VSTTTERHRTVLFAGSEIGSALELAAAFQSNWTEAFRRLFQERDANLVDEVERLLRHEHLDEALLLLSRPSSAAEVPRRFANLLAEMDPNLNPVYHGIRVTPAGLEAAAAHIIEAPGGDHESAVILEEVRNQNILTCWRSLPGMTNASAVQDVWTTQATQLKSAIESLEVHGFHPSESDWELAQAWVLACSVNPEHQTAQLANQVAHLDTTYAGHQPWWRELAAARLPEPISLVQALLSHATAIQQRKQMTESEIERQEKAEAARQRRAESAAAINRSRLVGDRQQWSHADWVLANEEAVGSFSTHQQEMRRVRNDGNAEEFRAMATQLGCGDVTCVDPECKALRNSVGIP
jgi:hypothetical protein